jgi:hypothetical protein
MNGKQYRVLITRTERKHYEVYVNIPDSPRHCWEDAEALAEAEYDRLVAKSGTVQNLPLTDSVESFTETPNYDGFLVSVDWDGVEPDEVKI